MKVLLVSLNREAEPFTAAPLGPALVAASLEGAGHDVRALDLLFSDEPERGLRDAVDGFGPELVGLSLRNIESSTLFLLPGYKGLVDKLKGITGSPIAVGGPGFSVMPEGVLRYLGLGLGVVGEGEDASVGLADALAGGRDPLDVPGVCLLRDGEFRLNPPIRRHLEGNAVRPAWRLFPTHRYDMVGVQSKRGCSFGCVYCTYPALEGRAMRLRSPSDVADEAASLAEYGVSGFYFVDNVFNNPKSHAEGICRELTARGAGAEWGALVTPVGLDEGFAALMKQAGCVSVEIGADSLSARALSGLGKPFGPDAVASAVRACKAVGLAHMVFLILGGPGEDTDTLAETFDALERIAPDKVFAVSGIRVYPGTPIAIQAVEEGVISGTDQLIEPRFYVSPKLGGRLYGLSDAFFEAHPDWIHYRADGVAATKAAQSDAELAWDDAAGTLLSEMLGEVPRLFRPMAKRAVMKRAAALASERGFPAVGASEVADAFVSETPAPFRDAMKRSLGRRGHHI